MTALTPILGRIAPLVGKLGSDHDGEVLAAARQLRRVLDQRGLSLNDLAAALEPQPERVVFVDAPAEWAPTTWQELARWIVEADRGQLQPHEREFVRSMTRRLVLGGEPTERQGQWLRGIYAKLGGAE